MKTAGYTVPWSASVGTEVGLHMSTVQAIEKVSIQRLDTPSKLNMDWSVVSSIEPARHESFCQGSYLQISKDELLKAGPVIAVSFEIFLTRNSGTRTILSSGEMSIRLSGDLLQIVYREKIIAQKCGIPCNTWLLFRVFQNPTGFNVNIESTDVLAPLCLSTNVSSEEDLGLGFGSELTIFKDPKDQGLTLNAQLSNVRLETQNGRYNWQFPTLYTSDPILSQGHEPTIALNLYNQPTFCKMSPRWDGSSFDPKIVPDQYDAIHCHDDDMAPLTWPQTHYVKVPDTAESGVYAFLIEGTSSTEEIVFFLTNDNSKAPVAVLLPTATYLAYSDEYLPEHLYPHKCSDRGHQFALDNNLRSLYDYHSDASGVSFCSYKKPKVTLRTDYNYPLCGCPHNLPVDLHFMKFLHRNNIHFDVITDHHLDRRGDDALDGYSALLTGSHPEYMTDNMEQTIRNFVANGGNLAYLGGNGFAASVALQDDLMELRRCALEGGRTWDGPVGELALSLTNEIGGFFRHRGRGEFSLVGSAISLMGFEEARPYTRTKASYSDETNWIFEGVIEETFGDEGIVLGGAAGYEVDATNKNMGTSQDTVVLATAKGFPSEFYHDPTRWYEGGASEEADRRCAEMTIRELRNGAQIFTVGSVAFLGALPADENMNDIGRLTLNVVNKFSSSQYRENSQLAAI